MILDELWHPQGGGGELCTYLYAKRMLSAGVRVTILTNRDVEPRNIRGECTFASLPFGQPKSTKPVVLLASPLIKRKIKSLAQGHDVAYIPGKLIFLAPWLKKANESIRIIAHLHDYQLVCPQSSLYNFLDRKTCNNIWSDLECTRCAWGYESAHGSTALVSILGAASGLAWKHASPISRVLNSVDRFVCVSGKQQSLIVKNLGEYSETFLRKSIVLYNPVDESVEYVLPSIGDQVFLGFFGGDRYLKGFGEALRITEHSGMQSSKLIAARVQKTGPGVDQRVELVGSLDRDQMRNVFRQTWIVLFTSLSEEPLPYMVMESQLRGRPVIATSLGGAIENIAKPGFTGNAAAPGKYDEFSRHIQEYCRMLRDRPEGYSREISAMSKEFFETRSQLSYDAFLKMVI
jgi:glycosyltransferase involved in cell wall biosynthesis